MTVGDRENLFGDPKEANGRIGLVLTGIVVVRIRS